MKHLFYIRTMILSTVFFLISVFSCNNVTAQVESFLLKDTSVNLVTNSKIRYVNDSVALGYYQTSQKGYFLVIDLYNASIISKVYLDSNYLFINDYHILNDTVYACGTFLEPPVWNGVILTFNINDIVQNDSKPTAFSDWTKIDNTTSLNRMVVYKNDYASGNIELVAIGYKEVIEGQYSSKYGRIVDFKSPSPGSATYKVRERYYSNTESESYDDIVLTENYIGIIGSVGNNTTSIRKTPRNCQDLLSGMIDTIYVYSYNHIEPASRQHATEAGGDRMQMATYAVNSNGQYRTHIRPFNLQNMSMQSGYDISMNNKSEPEEITYNGLLNSFFLLERLHLTNSPLLLEHQVVTQLPGGIIGQLSYYIAGQGFSSISTLSSNSCFLLAGGSMFAQKSISNNSQNSCFSTSTIMGIKVGAVTHSIIHDPTQAISNHGIWQNCLLFQDSLHVVKICLNNQQ